MITIDLLSGLAPVAQLICILGLLALAFVVAYNRTAATNLATFLRELRRGSSRPEPYISSYATPVEPHQNSPQKLLDAQGKALEQCSENQERDCPDGQHFQQLH